METIDYKQKIKDYMNSSEVDTLYKSMLNNLFPELKESEDERIRKAIHIYLDWLDGRKDYAPKGEYSIRDMIAWLEKQGEHANFLDKIQVGDKVTRNEDGVLVNLSQLNRVAKKDEKQGEQNPADTEKGAKGNEREIPNSAWSEEDEAIYYGVIETEQYMLDVVNGIKKFDVGNISIKKECTRELNWLKSLKDRYTWKPSDEQMDALKSSAYCQNKQMSKVLFGLYQDLLKLMEE